MPDQYRRATAAQKNSWDLAQYMLQHHCETLMARFNAIVDSPSYVIDVVQSEFISDRMLRNDMIDFARAVREIIFSIECTLGPATYPRA